MANPELLQKSATRIGELFSNKVKTPHGMNKGIKTPQDFMRILDNNEALNADWEKFCDVGKDDF
ncbi:MAG: hypothetical protein HDQ91_02765 [Desulfovibrio sp.]|nr:hypothetical protein [Desulfovibrio sp.]